MKVIFFEKYAYLPYLGVIITPKAMYK